MSRLKSRLLVGAALAAAAIGLAACGDDNDNTAAVTPTPTPTPTPAARFSEFGANFSTRFAAATTTEAADAAPSDITTALTLTAEPQAI